VAIVKQLTKNVVDNLFSDIMTSTKIIYTSMTENPVNDGSGQPNPANITGILVIRDITNSDFSIENGTSLILHSCAPISAIESGTATCVIFKTGSTNTDGIIKLIDKGYSAVTVGCTFTPTPIVFTFNQPTS
jgi:hypothetical protein